MGRARGHVGATPHSQSVTRPHRVTGQHAASSLTFTFDTHFTHFRTSGTGESWRGNGGKIGGGEEGAAGMKRKKLGEIYCHSIPGS